MHEIDVQEEVKNEEIETETIEEESSNTVEEKFISLEKYNELNDKLKSMEDRYVRLAAEYKNYQERSKKEKMAIRIDSLSEAVENILPVIDDLERAYYAASSAGDDYKKGIEMVQKRFNSTLKEMGVESFGEKNEEFNPEIHNASSHLEGDKNDKTIISEVYQKGYKINEKLIRPAMVQVIG
ncbi:MAG: nucleotide exchange factor GrpE [Firmicutes bacterium]|nr:nucleotide exchange factor GrpE [Bacillota bacterium]